MPLIQDSILFTAALRDSALATAVLVLAWILFSIIYRLNFHPLSHLPHPFLAGVSSLFLHTICYLGIEGRVLRYYHRKYKTKVLRVAPNSVSISDSDAIREIYITSGGFPKDARYTNFNLGPVVSIFSAIDTRYRDTRAKAVAPLFAPVRLRTEPNRVIGGCVAEFVCQLHAFKNATVKVDIVDLCARLSIDVVTEYLLGERYGGLGEHASLSPQARQKTKLSANPFIFAIVAYSRFSLLPNWLFRLIYAVSSRMNSSDEVVRSFVQLDQFIDSIMGNALAANDWASPSNQAADTTYQGRLLRAGISPAEAAAQAKAIVFAGADSTAVMLATILFHLVQNADARQFLLGEIRASKARATTPNDKDSKNAPPTDPQAMPYLRAVVKEGLRLGMANPTRLTRMVPATGLRVGAVHLPPGTVVGCAAYVLHHNPDTFPDPFAFRPERWLEDGQDNGLRRPDMEKSLIPFGAGLRACIGKNLAQQQLHETVMTVVDSEVLQGARTSQKRIEIIEWFNAEIKGHELEIEWSSE